LWQIDARNFLCVYAEFLDGGHYKIDLPFDDFVAEQMVYRILAQIARFQKAVYISAYFYAERVLPT
jgi:hypothetical protein